jgi:flagellar motor switch protein FliN/FliY
MSETNTTEKGAETPPKGGKAENNNLDFILDIPLEITVELGRTRMMVNELLKLGQGSVIELGKIAGETLEILANKRLIARGDVVVINDKYGIRLTEVISPAERVEKLG